METTKTPGTDTLDQLSRPFTTADRCDGCSAQAHTEYVMTYGTLLFCGHHSRKNHDALMAQGAVFFAEEEVAAAADVVLDDEY